MLLISAEKVTNQIFGIKFLARKQHAGLQFLIIWNFFNRFIRLADLMKASWLGKQVDF